MENISFPASLHSRTLRTQLCCKQVNSFEKVFSNLNTLLQDAWLYNTEYIWNDNNLLHYTDAPYIPYKYNNR